MLNVGVIVPNLSTSQLAFMAINQCNLFRGNPNTSCVLFYCDAAHPCVEPKTPLMNVTEIHGFKGLLISTDIDSTLASIKAASSSKRLFYVWDLEWIRPGKNNFGYNIQAYRNEKITLCARSDEHAKAISDYCNRQDILVVPNLNIPELVKTVMK